jgi:tripeptidyl-peptidase I
MLGICSFVLASLAAVAANPCFEFIIHEKLGLFPPGFLLRGPAQSDTTLDLRFALRQNDITGLEKSFLEISNPDSPQYGRHLSQQQVTAYVEPSADTLSKVTSWLSSHNLTATNASHAGDWIQVSGIPAGKANKMLNADFSLFTHEGSGKQTVRTLAYSLPAELQNHIDLVHPTVKYVQEMRRITRFIDIFSASPLSIFQRLPAARYPHLPSFQGASLANCRPHVQIP